MKKWIVDGLVVGIVTAAIGGSISLLLSRNAKAVLLGSSLGALTSAAIVAERRDRSNAALKEELSRTRRSLQNTRRVPRPLKRSDQPQNGSIDRPRSPRQMATATPKALTLKTWLQQQRVTVEDSSQPTSEIDDIFNKHAIYLGQNLSDSDGRPLLAPVLKKIKWSIANKRGLQVHLKKSPQAHIGLITSFLRSLNEDTLLSGYRYDKNSKIVHAAIQDRGDVRAFFNGTWFEKYIFHQVSQRLTELEVPCTHLMNPIVRFPNGDSFELDLLLFVNQQPVLIECKTGSDFNAHLKKFSDHRQKLNVRSDSAFLVVLDLPEEKTARLRKFWDFTATNQDNFLPLLEEALFANVTG